MFNPCAIRFSCNLTNELEIEEPFFSQVFPQKLLINIPKDLKERHAFHKGGAIESGADPEQSHTRPTGSESLDFVCLTFFILI